LLIAHFDAQCLQHLLEGLKGEDRPLALHLRPVIDQHLISQVFLPHLEHHHVLELLQVGFVQEHSLYVLVVRWAMLCWE